MGTVPVIPVYVVFRFRNFGFWVGALARPRSLSLGAGGRASAARDGTGAEFLFALFACDAGAAGELPGGRDWRGARMTGGRGLRRLSLPQFWILGGRAGAPAVFATGRNKATANRPPLLKCCATRVSSNERLRVGDWIVQGLYNDAVKEGVEFRLLPVFQHVVDPAGVRTIADKNSAVTPLYLRPTVAD